ncbi:hypothetical protein BGZ46_007068 [Entomortierella lignicola]|nr:hypothetical protein BGZ46_007068 [Entomortierella lignicola]
MPRVQDTTINTNNWTVEECERDSSDKGNQIDEMSEWEILKAMEDEGISVWKNWCKFQDTSSTVDPRKIILFIDSYVLPRENALLQKIKTDAKSHQANGDATPVSMIETLVRPVMRLWSYQNKKEKYTKRSSHPDFISDSSPEGEHGKDDGVEQDKDFTFIEARVNPSSKSRGRDTTSHERNSIRLEKRPKPDRPGLVRMTRDVRIRSGANSSCNNSRDRSQVQQTAGSTSDNLSSLSDQTTMKPFKNIFVNGKLPRTTGSRELNFEKTDKVSLKPFANTLPSLYRQWSESRNDRLSVASMNEQFGTSWRQEEEAEYYDKGVTLVSEVGRLVDKYKLSVEQALRRMEEERARKRMSLSEFASEVSKYRKGRTELYSLSK